MATYWPLSIVEHGVGLNITVMSYAGAMGFGFTTARCAVPDAGELCKALMAALEELVARTRLDAPRKAAAPVKAARPLKRPKVRAASGGVAPARGGRAGAQKP